MGKMKALFKQKDRQIILQNAAAQQFKDGLKNTIKQERIDTIINQGDNTDEARAIEKLLAKKKEIKQKAGTHVCREHEVDEDYDVSHEQGHNKIKQFVDEGTPVGADGNKATGAFTEAAAEGGGAAEGG